MYDYPIITAVTCSKYQLTQPKPHWSVANVCVKLCRCDWCVFEQLLQCQFGQTQHTHVGVWINNNQVPASLWHRAISAATYSLELQLQPVSLIKFTAGVDHSGNGSTL